MALLFFSLFRSLFLYFFNHIHFVKLILFLNLLDLIHEKGAILECEGCDSLHGKIEFSNLLLCGVLILGLHQYLIQFRVTFNILGHTVYHIMTLPQLDDSLLQFNSVFLHIAFKCLHLGLVVCLALLLENILMSEKGFHLCSNFLDSL